jgi:hypothetical protein
MDGRKTFRKLFHAVHYSTVQFNVEIAGSEYCAAVGDERPNSMQSNAMQCQASTKVLAGDTGGKPAKSSKS